MLNSYCYINSTFLVPSTDRKTISTYPGFGPFYPGDHEIKLSQSYYQWAAIVLFLQVCHRKSSADEEKCKYKFTFSLHHEFRELPF